MSMYLRVRCSFVMKMKDFHFGFSYRPVTPAPYRRTLFVSTFLNFVKLKTLNCFFLRRRFFCRIPETLQPVSLFHLPYYIFTRFRSIRTSPGVGVQTFSETRHLHRTCTDQPVLFRTTFPACGGFYFPPLVQCKNRKIKKFQNYKGCPKTTVSSSLLLSVVP